MSEIQKKLAGLKGEDWRNPLLRMLRQKYTEKGMPLRGLFELTPHCTLDCKMCYVHSSSGKYAGRVLNGDEWISIMDGAVEEGMLYAALTGGECLVHPDFRRIYCHLREKGVFVSFFTNATLLNEEMVDWLSVRKPYRLKITVYGSNPEEYEAVTGDADAFYKVDKALDLLYEARIVTDISITVSKYNYPYFENILRYVKNKHYSRLGIDADMTAPREETGKDINDFSLSLSEQEAVWNTFYRLNGKEIPVLCDEDFAAIERKYTYSEENAANANTGMPCAAGRCSFFIDYNGFMMPCIAFPYYKVDVLKNGAGDSWKKINNESRKYRRSRECMDCQYFDICSFCPGKYMDHSGVRPCDKRKYVFKTIMYQKQEEI